VVKAKDSEWWMKTSVANLAGYSMRPIDFSFLHCLKGILYVFFSLLTCCIFAKFIAAPETLHDNQLPFGPTFSVRVNFS
jgi:hypothetical protein